MINHMQKKENIFAAVIFTPYLATNIEDMEKAFNSSEIKEQIEKYGYDSNNLNGVRVLVTPKKKKVFLETMDDYVLPSPAMADLIIIGSAGLSEPLVEAAKGSGLVMARYSMFYSGPSRYTGRSAEEGGYSLDMPKSVSVAKALLTNDDVLDAIVAREEAQVRKALDKLNEKLDQPVLATPYLAKALEIKRRSK